MAEDLIGSITLMAYNFEVEDYFLCDGRQLQISQYPALYSLIGNKWGGDGHNYFNLPKMEPADKNMRYYICHNGYYPSRA